MRYHSELDHSFQDWRNYSRKVPYSQVPHFKFPSVTTSSPITTTPLQTNIIPETTTMEVVKKFFKDIITPLTFSSERTMTESSIGTSTTANAVINTTFSDIVGLTPNNTFNESLSSNNSVISDIMENTTGPSITSLMKNGTVPIDAAQNGTGLMEAMGNNGTILTTVSDIASTTAENTVSIINSTTEKAITFVTEAVHKISTSTEANNHNHDHVPHYHYAMGSHRLLYVILLIIVAVLILIGVVLLLIYIRYRKNSFRVLQNYYEISPMKERTPSDQSTENQKQCPPEVYMHYHG